MLLIYDVIPQPRLASNGASGDVPMLMVQCWIGKLDRFGKWIYTQFWMIINIVRVVQ
jgi:hypothetical protein